MSPSPVGTGPRTDRGRRRRTAIVRAAAELTLQGGYDSATIDRIAERAGVARRTVFTHFESKDDILFAWAPSGIERALHHLDADYGGPVDRIRAWLDGEGQRGGLEAEDGVAALALRAIQRDPRLRAREAELFLPVQAAIARRAADALGLPVGHDAPLAFAAAAMGSLAELSARLTASDTRPEAPDAEAVLALLAGGLEALRAAYSSGRRPSRRTP